MEISTKLFETTMNNLISKKKMKKYIHSKLLVIPNAITLNEEQELLQILKHPDIEWQDIFGKWASLKNRRFGWGESRIDIRNEPQMPHLIEAVGDNVRERFLKEVPDIPKFRSCTANKYPVGEGLGLHNDGKAWLPFVMGITLNSARHMEFFDPTTKERLIIETPRLSAYLFFSNVYDTWYHSSMKGSKSGKYYQYATAYSLTYRTCNESYTGDTYESRINDSIYNSAKSIQ